MLKVHKLSKNDQTLIKFISEGMVALQWFVGLEDIENCVVSEIPGIYVAILDKQPIGFVSFSKYSSNYFVFGDYYIKEEHRRKGYGIKMFTEASKDAGIDWSQTTQIVSAYAVPHMIKPYEMKYGFQSRWLCGWYSVDMPLSLETLMKLVSKEDKSVIVKDIKSVDKGELLAYDATVYGYQRDSFIWGRMNVKGSHVKVAVNESGAIQGYAAARAMYSMHDGYGIGPLFADSIVEARLLLKELFEEILHHGLYSSQNVQKISMSCPIEINSSSKSLIDSLSCECLMEVAFVTTNGIPNGCFEKWFGITDLDMG